MGTEASAAAEQRARAADTRFRACAELRPGPAGGLRVGVKDTVDVAGFATRLGLRRYRHHPERSAPVLSGLPPGSVVAKLATTELGIGLEHGCVNPCFPHLDPAGSSTGCAVAVAAGIVDLAMGTDTVASIRLPASACGVVGLRLTHDRRLLDGIFPLSAHLDAPGWLTRTAEDMHSLWHRHRLDGGLVERAPASEGPLRIAVVDETLRDDVHPEIREAFETAAELAAKAGHRVSTVRLGDLFHRRGLAYELCAREAWDSWRETPAVREEPLAESTRLALESGARVSDARYAELLDLHEQARRTAALLIAEHGADAWLMPAGTMMPRDLRTEAAPASTIPDPTETGSSPRVNYAALAGFAGLPAITFPIAHSAAYDAPMGLQAVGAPRGEARLIELARELTVLTGDVRFQVPAAPSSPGATAAPGDTR